MLIWTSQPPGRFRPSPDRVPPGVAKRVGVANRLGDAEQLGESGPKRRGGLNKGNGQEEVDELPRREPALPVGFPGGKGTAARPWR